MVQRRKIPAVMTPSPYHHGLSGSQGGEARTEGDSWPCSSSAVRLLLQLSSRKGGLLMEAFLPPRKLPSVGYQPAGCLFVDWKHAASTREEPGPGHHIP